MAEEDEEWENEDQFVGFVADEILDFIHDEYEESEESQGERNRQQLRFQHLSSLMLM